MSSIEKIKRYNQILLAIGGTLAVFFILAIGLFILTEEWNRYTYEEFYQEGVLATETTNDLIADSLRQQIISFNNVTLLDSATKTYVLPVQQADLLKKESVDEILGLVNTFNNYPDNYEKYTNADYNNLVIYESLNNKSQVLFEERIGISSYRSIRTREAIYLLIIGTNKDSNKDGYLNSNDLQDLFIYDVKKHQITKVTTKENLTVLTISEEKITQDVMGKFGLDRNKDGEFQADKEPMILYKIDLSSKRLIKIVTDEQIEQLQKLLEGS